MSYHQLNDALYQIESAASNMQNALAVLADAKLTKKQQDALAIINANRTLIINTSDAARSLCGVKVDEALKNMHAKLAKTAYEDNQETLP